MNREQVIRHIVTAVENSQGKEDDEIINKVYAAVKPNASRSSKSALRRLILSGDYFGANFIFFLELLNQCGLDVIERD